MADSQSVSGELKPARSMLDHALDYAEKRWKVLPVWWLNGSQCACPKGASCVAPGKHPIGGHGLHDATSGAPRVGQWWKQWPNANIGIACRASGLLVLDVDP